MDDKERIEHAAALCYGSYWEWKRVNASQVLIIFDEEDKDYGFFRVTFSDAIAANMCAIAAHMCDLHNMAVANSEMSLHVMRAVIAREGVPE